MVRTPIALKRRPIPIPGITSGQEVPTAVRRQKPGHRLGVRPPKPTLDQVDLAGGAPVEVAVEGDHLVIWPVRRRLTLGASLDRCKPGNRPDPIDFGPPAGKEMI